MISQVDPQKSLNRDAHPFRLDEQTSPYLLNANFESREEEGSQVVTNEPSTLLCHKLKQGMVVIGTYYVAEQDRLLLFLAQPPLGFQEAPACDPSDVFVPGWSEIGEIQGPYYIDRQGNRVRKRHCTHCPEITADMDPLSLDPLCLYRTLIGDTCLNFSVHHPIDAEVKLTDCDFRLYWVDGFNPDRYAYFNYLNGQIQDPLQLQDRFRKVIGRGSCNEPIYREEINCEQIRQTPATERICLTVREIVKGGQLESGVFQFFAAYSDGLGNALTDYQAQTGVVPVFSRKLTDRNDYQTNLALNLEIRADSSVYQFYTLVAVHTQFGVRQVKKVGTFPVTQAFYTYTGGSTLADLSLTQLLTRKVYYEHSQGITQSNHYLFKFGLAEKRRPNWQRMANLIRLYWQTTQLPEGVYKQGEIAEQYKGYLRDEVYAFAIVFEWDDGEDSPAIHLPGRLARAFERQLITNADALNGAVCSLEQNYRWQVYNTGSVLTKPHQPYVACQDTVWETGEMAYWESTERYPEVPEIWGDLCGQPIRHHKFPDSCVTHIHDGYSQNGSLVKLFTDTNMIYPIGIQVDHESVKQALLTGLANCWIHPDDVARIKSYRIVRGNRVGNESITAKGLLYDVWKYRKANRDIYYPNHAYNDLRPDSFIGNSADTYDNSDSSPDPFKLTFTPTGRYTFHSPEVHFGPASSATVVKLETVEFGECQGNFEEAQGQARQKFISTLSAAIALSAGIAAALATEEKECVTYVKRSPSIDKHYDGTSESTSGGSSLAETILEGATSVVSAIPGIGDLLGSVMSAITGVVNGATQSGEYEGIMYAGDTPVKKEFRLDARKTDYNNLDLTDSKGNKMNAQGETNQGGLIGQFIPVTQAEQVAEYSRTVCTNTKQDLMNASSSNKVANTVLKTINSLAGGFFSLPAYQVMQALQEIKIVRDLIESLIPWKNLNLQYNSVGKYSNYQCIPNETGQKIRALETTAMLTPEVQSVVEGDKTINFNNWNRESSYYLKTLGTLLPSPPIADRSRFTASEKGLTRDTVHDTVTGQVSSFYASLKNIRANQYGQLEGIQYLETGMCSRYLADEPTSQGIFGGDTFINRFALKRKLAYFTQTRFNQADGSEVRYSKLGNVGFPNYYYDTYTNIMDSLEGMSLGGSSLLDIFDDIKQIFQSALGVPKNRLDLDGVREGNVRQMLFFQYGFIYLYDYGIPSFVAESSINVDLRTGANTTTQNFYPNVADLNEWLQEKTVPITWDNFYGYNFDYSKQATENTLVVPARTELPNRICQTNHPNRVIYSDPSQELDYSTGFDNWRMFRASNYHDFSLRNGKLISVDGIESDKVLVRQENATDIFSAYVTLQTDQQSIQVSNGGMFQSRPQQYATTDLGYFGSQHRALLRTEYGHVSVDAKRGQVFLLGNNGSGLDEISKNGLFHWFKNNLPFHLSKLFPLVPVDNSYYQIGLTMGYDARLHRFFLTKKDYIPRSLEVQYDPIYREFFVWKGGRKQVVELTDSTYFCDASWTVKYDFYTKTWVYFSWAPNYYVSGQENFRSGIYAGRGEAGSIWYHGLTNKSYQIFYGQVHPFIVETQSRNEGGSQWLNQVEYRHEVIRYHNLRDQACISGVTYTKAIVSNANQCSGLLELHVDQGHNQANQISYPVHLADRTQVLVSQVNNSNWRFNEFRDCVTSQYRNNPLWLWSCSAHRKTLNRQMITYGVPEMENSDRRIRRDQVRVLLINDQHTYYQFQHLWTAPMQRVSEQ